ncbi:MAG: aspartate kinase [Spirochaetales bacterium]|nr:aspartate kinase [Spirochaetales bacterium]
MLTVEKIGGTSMSKFHDVLNNIILKNGKVSYNRILVVSAYDNVTNWLLEHKKTGEPGVYTKFINDEPYSEALDKLCEKLLSINDTFLDIKLNSNEARQYLLDRIKKTKDYLESMTDVIASGYVDHTNIHFAARELLASVGEAHSAYNSVNILKNNNINAILVDLSGFHDSEYLTIDERIRKAFKKIDFSKTIVVATGYTKGTEGIMREFDRGYSEVTFSKIAVEVKADEAIIHKEFHLSSADPKIVGIEKAIPVGFTNYDVADQLADVGMEAIHPKASKPLEKNNISLRIKNTFEPDHPGTVISKSYIGKESKVEIIAGSNKVIVIEIHDSSMVGESGFDMHVMQLFHNYRISYIMKATNANSITLVIWEKDLHEELLNKLRDKYEQVTINHEAIVCIIGSNIAKPGVLAKTADALASNKVNVECISQSLRQVNIQLIVGRNDFEKAVSILNDTLCSLQK